jgi:hypothetical protein
LFWFRCPSFCHCGWLWFVVVFVWGWLFRVCCGERNLGAAMGLGLLDSSVFLMCGAIYSMVVLWVKLVGL